MSSTLNIRDYKVWVFAPYLETNDPNLQFYCDYSQSIAEYSNLFGQSNIDWEWCNVTIENIDKTVQKVKNSVSNINIVLNLCDGDELNGVPGISVIKALNEENILYTGADEYFYHVTTSKVDMKNAFDEHHVSTSPWVEISKSIPQNIFDTIGEPIIVKPAVSAGSMGLGVHNVVSNMSQLNAAVEKMKKGYHGWALDADGIIAEKFIAGREFTTLVVGSSTHPEKLSFYAPAERVFHSSLPEKEKFLSFDRLWETYTNENQMPDDGFFYEYSEVKDAPLLSSLKELSFEAFMSVNGMGYGRLDIRMENETGKLFVLEVNAQCGLSEDENYTSIGAILKFSNKTFTELIFEILNDAINRKSVPSL